MANIAIRAENVSKTYKVRSLSRPDTIRDTICYGVERMFRGTRGCRTNKGEETFWALNDVSFEVTRGETVGVIGYNGAGKSTLLKVLSRITVPTGGRVELWGRVSSLLEVGTGFHPELTGRENIYLNGATLGMRKSEIARKFDEIVDFAEVERFLDTPVKRYSSGMYMRLAFAVAAHLEPDILLVDEVLAVGDARFQRKCLNKMKDVGQDGRTVLFVSHSMAAITRLCQRAILLDEGRIVRDGAAQHVVGAYLTSENGTTASREWPDLNKAPRTAVARLCAVRVRDCDGRVTDTLDIQANFTLEMEYEVLVGGHTLMPHFQLYSEDGIHVFSAHDIDPVWRHRARPVGRYVSTVEIPGNLLNDGMMFAGAGLYTVDPFEFQFYVADAIAFQVTETYDGSLPRGDYAGKMGGVVRPLLRWRTAATPSFAVMTATAQGAERP